MHENYELNGKVRKLEQRSERRFEGLDHIRDQKSFDLEFSPTVQVQSSVDYTHAGFTHSSKTHVYDPTGRLLRTLSFDRTHKPIETSEFEYDSEGTRIGWTSREPSGQVTARGMEQYDGKLLTMFATFRGDLPCRTKSFEWRGSTLRRAISDFIGAGGQLAERWIENYDSDGRLLETFGLKADGKPLGDGRYTYEYDEQGRKSKVWTYEDLSGDTVPSSVCVYEYDYDGPGNWIARRTFHRSRSDASWSMTAVRRRIAYYE